MEPFKFKNRSPATTNTPAATRVAKKKKVLPRVHMTIAGGLVFSLLVIASLPSQKAEASREAVVVRLPVVDEEPIEQEEPNLFASTNSTAAVPAAQMEPLIDDDVTVVEETVLSGDSLSRVFQRAGLNDKAMLALVNSSKEAKALAKIFPGHTLSFAIDKQGQLRSLTHSTNRLRSDLYTATDSGFTHQTLEKTPDVQLAMRSSTITSSLYKAGISAGLNDKLIMELAGIFGWDVDFALDIRSGDSFRILFEEQFLDGERLGTGSILAAEFVNQNTTFKAVRYLNSDGKAQYYSPSGNSMQKAFLRAPLDFRRISSNFNPRRLHPITKTVRPHRGTDYAANQGTPVWASGDGRVVESGYNKANGNYVVIQHGGEVQTKYLHLHKRSVKRGDRVTQKQLIGTVGSTGMSTAPHLHYEFLVSGVHRNPRTIIQKLPKAESIDKAELQRFYAQTQPLLAQLEQSTKMASLKRDTTNL